MRSLASFIMRGPLQAALVTAAAALVPLLFLFSGAAVTLVTLRQGRRAGMTVIVMGTCLTVVPIWLFSGSTTPVTVGLLSLFWLPLWGLAMVLRTTVALAKTLQVALLFAILVLLIFAIYTTDLALWGQHWLEQVLNPLLQQLPLTTEEQAIFAQGLDALTPLVVGLLIANGLASVLLSLLLGRWWQAVLFNPGGFRNEFHELRLGQPMALGTLLVFGIAWLTKSPLFANVIPLLVVIYTLQGIALLHGIASKLKLAQGWLVGFYLLLLLALPQVLTLLCLVSISDAWLDFRARIKPPAEFH